MSNDKPLNAMYGQKVKLDLDKIRNRNKEEVVEAEPVEEPVVEAVEEPVVDEPVEEVVEDEPDEVVDEPVEEVVEDEPDEVVDEPVEEVVEDEPDEVVDEPVEEVVEDEPDEVVDEPVEEVVEEKPSKNEEKTSDKSESKLIKDLKVRLGEREKKLSNQSSELNYLTNKVIPKLKKENAELKGLKKELTDALEKSTRKYFDQLDINADLSNQIGKLGAEGAVNKVRADKLENEIKSVKEELESKIDHYKEKLASINVDELKNENSNLSTEIADLKEKLASTRKENIDLSEEVDKLRSELIELGNYKDEVDTQNKEEIQGYKSEISSLTTQLKLKESSYDKLSNESKSTIADLNKHIVKLEDELEKQSNKGLFNRFK